MTSLKTAAKRADMQAAFDDCLLTAPEMRHRGALWETPTDGFEPWLGEIRSIA
ncbi:MAG: hypothetical protein ABI112_04860 [Terracoccus sp.]